MDFKKESELFNQAAGYYDKFRPSYPGEIIDALIQHAHLTRGSRMRTSSSLQGVLKNIPPNRIHLTRFFPRRRFTGFPNLPDIKSAPPLSKMTAIWHCCGTCTSPTTMRLTASCAPFRNSMAASHGFYRKPNVKNESKPLRGNSMTADFFSRQPLCGLCGSKHTPPMNIMGLC